MADWGGFTLTRLGRNLQAKIEAGLVKLEFTKLKLGDGVIEEGQSLEELIDLVSPKQNIGITAIEPKENGICTIYGVVNNIGLEKGYNLKELGLFAAEPDEGEILYAIMTDSHYDYLQAEGGATIVSEAFNLNISINSNSNVIAVIDANGILTNRTGEILIGQLIKEHNEDEQAHEVIVNNLKTLIDNSGLNLLKRNKTYSVGDIAYSPNLPSWARLECVQAGTTADTEPDYAQMFGGVLLTDGTVMFVVDDIREYLPVGTVIYLPILRPGYTKANGATVQRADYPRLIQFADKYSLWTDDTTTNPWAMGVGDGSTTMVLPDYRGKVLQGGDDAAVLVAGLPNLIGRIEAIDADDGILFEKLYIVNKGAGRNTALGNHWLHEFKASRYNPIYGASDTVQPPAIQLIAQIKY